MSVSAEGSLQKALFDLLSADVALSAVITGVFDSVPESQAYPYVELGEGTAIPFDSNSSDGQEHLITIHTWTEAKGRKTAHDIMTLVYTALHNVALVVAGHQTILCQFDFSTVLKDPDGFTHHGVQRFRVITEDN